MFLCLRLSMGAEEIKEFESSAQITVSEFSHFQNITGKYA